MVRGEKGENREGRKDLIFLLTLFDKCHKADILSLD